MAELTFAQRWRVNHIPVTDFRLETAPLTSGANCVVNGLLLPSTFAKDTQSSFIHLPSSAIDWIPFFSSVDMANTAIKALGNKINVQDPEDVFGFMFSPKANAVSIIAEVHLPDGQPTYGYYKLCNFGDTTRTLMRRIAALGEGVNIWPAKGEKVLYTPCARTKYVSVPSLPTDKGNPWYQQGSLPTSSAESYRRAKAMFERIYGRALSEVPGCHD